jgi:Arc/MetJ family transcription regulator
MRTNIEIDDELLRRAMRATGARTKKGAVEAAMRLTVRLKAQESIRELWGIGWEGDLNAMRKNRFLDKDGFPRQDLGHEVSQAPRPKRRRHPEADDSKTR